MPVTMHDVAAAAGVSQRTVSNVVNNYEHIRPATRRRVLDAIEQLGYRPNVSAQRMRSGRTGLVALAVPEIAAPYFAELADHVQRTAQAHGVTLLIDQTGGDLERERLVLDGYRTHLIDGLILSPLALTEDDLGAHTPDLPVVLLGESVTAGRLLHVSVDNVAAACDAATHLITLGREQIAAVGTPSDAARMGPASRRMTGFVAATQDHGRRSDLLYPTSTWSRAEGYRVATQIIKNSERVDALFCFNDLLALGAIKALSDLGVRVPDDVAIVGWDDIEEAAFSTPGLTSIAPDLAAIAATAVAGVLGLPDDGVEVARDVTAAHTLEIRGSSYIPSSHNAAAGHGAERPSRKRGQRPKERQAECP